MGEKMKQIRHTIDNPRLSGVAEALVVLGGKDND